MTNNGSMRHKSDYETDIIELLDRLLEEGLEFTRVRV
jgi:hypothetical protein